MDYPKLPCVGLCKHWADKCLLKVDEDHAKDCLKWYKRPPY